MEENTIKKEIIRILYNCDLETLQAWIEKYNTNLFKIRLDDETNELLKMLFMAKDFLNIKNPRLLDEYYNQMNTAFFGKRSFDIFAIETILQDLYTNNIENSLGKSVLSDYGAVQFEGTEIKVMQFGSEFNICTGTGEKKDVNANINLSLGTNENLGIDTSKRPIFGYENFDGNFITSMSSKKFEKGPDIFDDIDGMANSTREGENNIEVFWCSPDYVLALDEITEEDKKAAKENGIPIYFLDRAKLAITESQKMDAMEANFFKELNPLSLRRLIKVYFNNRNSFREREDLKEKYFDPLEMQVRLSVIIDELEKYINSKVGRRVNLCLRYIHDALEEEERLLEGSKKDEKEMNIEFLKKKINTIFQKNENKLIEDTVNQAVNDLEGRNDLTEIEKAYYMYLRLGSVLKHDPTYTLETNSSEKRLVYQYDINQEGYGICKSISEEYQKALARIGIDSEITEVVPGGPITHKDLVIKTRDGKKYFCNLIGDLSNIQTGKRTRNFAIGKEKIEKSSINFGREYYFRLDAEVGDFTVLSEEELEQMDNKFKHTYKGIYTNDMFKMLKKEIKDKKFLAELFETDDQDELLVRTFEFLMEKVGIVNAYNSENMGFYEVIRYYDRLASYVFDDEEKKHFKVFSDLVPISQEREKTPGCVIVLNVDLPNSQTGKKENQNIFYEYSSEEKTFKRVKKEDIMAKFYMSVDRKVGVPLNEIIRRLEKSSLQKSIKNELGDFYEAQFADK